MKNNLKKFILNFILTNYKIYKFSIKVIKIIFSRIYLRIFSIGLKVPKWHLNATYESRAYKNQVIKICNKYATNYVIEIGCGIGEIISRLNASKKYGLDINNEALIMCKRLDKNIKTIQLDIMKNNNKLKKIINSIPIGEHILLIMVNWLHQYSEKEVSNMLNSILCINRKIIIIADIYERKELSKISHNKVVHEFKNIKNKFPYKRINKIDEVRDLAIFSNCDI